MARSALITALVSVVLFSLGLLPAQGKPAPKKLAKPVADAQIEAMDKLYAKLLEVIKKNKVDPRRDDLPAINEKREAVSQALDEFAANAKRLTFDRRHLGLDYVRFAETTFPRLSGRVVKVGPNEGWEDLQAAVTDIEPGDVVLLGEGEYVLPKIGGEWRDIAIVGLGRDKTTLTCRLERVTRVRLAAMKIDCKNDEFIYFRDGGTVQIQNCLITNYNSGAGGSNAIFGSGATFLIEDSKFEGMTGEAKKKGSGGDAFDLRGKNFLYVRKTDFIDNEEIVRATSFCVFDRCRSMTRARSQTGINLYDSGFLMVRRNLCEIRGKPSAQFDVSTDDLAVVKYLRHGITPLDDEMKAAVAALGLRDNLRYWATLLHHTDREVQFIASGRLASLLRRAMPSIRIDRNVINQVPKEMRKPFEAALRSGRALRWIEENDSRLSWSDKSRAYVLNK